eukprot:CAMPEP_0206219740 /NCGR_PEP_ID=MMETSP0047_2-20121206/4476_1 /ASSEMBLY_ACC=CAM_ASM_000192 /TAXON_ID=195065 /ORGANISM="Chroomonas mesostigmatica_cf, Strain CCMP1168" /LENGTH=80 /DNA_ID=CAMNT_0053642295 /DNA_START=350 /DNA_END=592 /DNA_ORIENTATION=-
MPPQLSQDLVVILPIALAPHVETGELGLPARSHGDQGSEGGDDHGDHVGEGLPPKEPHVCRDPVPTLMAVLPMPIPVRVR